MDEKLLRLLEENARLSNKELAAALGVSEQEVADEIKLLENTGVIKAYKAFIDTEKHQSKPLRLLLSLKLDRNTAGDLMIWQSAFRRWRRLNPSIL